MFSAVVAPDVAPAAWSWLPLITGLAVHDAVQASVAANDLALGLKWPNDVLVAEQKLAGILVQVSGPNAVIGIGLNVSTTRAELGLDTATSLLLAGAGDVDRAALLIAILAELGSHYRRWTDAGGDAAKSGQAEDYRARCSTIGRLITVIDGGGERAGTAVGVDDDGRLRVRWAQTEPGDLTEHAVAAGDIVHLRVGSSAG
jgi:BirA family biotin operon repressor/biotin-[acetyl-CoA-carboxylase] ligase